MAKYGKTKIVPTNIENFFIAYLHELEEKKIEKKLFFQKFVSMTSSPRPPLTWEKKMLSRDFLLHCSFIMMS